MSLTLAGLLLHGACWLTLRPLRQSYEFTREQVFEDMCSDLGFMKALQLALRIKPFGLMYGGVPCESFSFMGSATHGRHATNPFGNAWPFVARGSICCTRLVLLALLCTVRGGVWFIENPALTVLPHFPAVRLLMQKALMPLQVKWSGT